MLFFKKKKKEEEEELEEEPKKRKRKINRNSKKELPWGRKERILVAIVFLITVIFSLFFAIEKGNFRIDSPFGKTEVYEAPSQPNY
ncbi:hypothetical protein HYS03_00035 [Candidatus Woesebacteria bacterium]|nr:hypothetical protein [Candidatus Woesebacteria bacterium]QQG47584.1 MAG: hypothetical protein HY044_00640 [Candidatus Woesebacteria bacterium]